jgi:hypothetical protein
MGHFQSMTRVTPPPDHLDVFRQRHRKTKSEPPIKVAFYPRPLIEFCLNTKVYGISLYIESKESYGTLILTSFHLNHHKQTETFGMTINLDQCQIFTGSIMESDYKGKE